LGGVRFLQNARQSPDLARRSSDQPQALQARMAVLADMGVIVLRYPERAGDIVRAFVSELQLT
jgi:hypothetical protein